MSCGFTLVSRKRQSEVVSTPSFGDPPKRIGVSHTGLTDMCWIGASGGAGESTVPSASSTRVSRRWPTVNARSKLVTTGLRNVNSSCVPKWSATLSSDSSKGSSGIDRKSTRLNSSHTVISYAVFCLKKKKKKTNRHCYKHKKECTTQG